MKKLFNVNVKKYSKEKSFEIYRPSSLDYPLSNSVMFVMDRYIEKSHILNTVDNCLVFWPKTNKIPEEIQSRHVFVMCDMPRKEFNRFFIENNIISYPRLEPFNIIDGAYICKSAKIGNSCTIMPGVYIGGEVCVGKNVYIGCGVKIVGRVVIGNDVIIRENSVIGADGLSTDRDSDGSALTMPQFGGVIVGDQVQIGANTVICRGAIDDTVIGTGSKIDNCCFISHNVILEENVFVVGETLMMGSSRAKKNAYISGNVVIRNKTTIEEGAFIGMGAVVTKDVKARTIVMGNPAKPRDAR